MKLPCVQGFHLGSEIKADTILRIFMTPISHALLPVFLGRRWIPHKNKIPVPRIVALVALCGALPDILSPHLSLDARYTALSHTAWALLAFSLAIAALSRLAPTLFTPSISLLCLAAYAGHLFCDAIAGGIAFFHPVSSAVQGKHLLPFWLWITSDGLLLFYLYVIYRWQPLRRRIKERSQRTCVAPAD